MISSLPISRSLPTATSTPLLDIEELSVGIVRQGGCVPAVQGVECHIAAREIVGIVGESGCGKTLTALSIPGLLPHAARITGGTIRLDGCSLTTLPESALCAIRGRDVAIVFQEPALNPVRTIGPQIAETLELHDRLHTHQYKNRRENRERNQRQVLALMESLGLPDPPRLARCYPHQLSGGMRQRVMIAMAVAAQPKLLIADEPTSSVDTRNQTQILALLEQIHQDTGMAILFISHDLGLVHRFCHRIMVMYGGRIIEEGPAAAVFTAPGHEYTRALLAALPRQELRGTPLAAIPGRAPSLEELAALEQHPACVFAPRCSRALDACRCHTPTRRIIQTPGGMHTAWCVHAPGEESV